MRKTKTVKLNQWELAVIGQSLERTQELWIKQNASIAGQASVAALLEKLWHAEKEIA